MSMINTGPENIEMLKEKVGEKNEYSQYSVVPFTIWRP